MALISPTGLLGTYLGNVRGGKSLPRKFGKAITGLPSLLGGVLSDPRFQESMDRLAMSEQRIPSDDLYYRAKAREAQAEAKATRAEQGRQAAFMQTLGNIENKRDMQRDVRRNIAARTSPENVRAQQAGLLQQELGPAAFHSVMPPIARPSTPGLLRKQPTATEIALTSGISGFDQQNRPIRGAVNPLVDQTPAKMTQSYVESLMGPTAAEKEILAFNPEREYLLQMAKSGDPIAVRQGVERLGGGGDPSDVSTFKYLQTLAPDEREAFLNTARPSLKYVERGDGTEVHDSQTNELVGFIPKQRDLVGLEDIKAEQTVKDMAPINREQWQNATASSVVQDRIGVLLKHLEAPNAMTTGVGADLVVGFKRLQAALGDEEARKSVTATQIATAMMGSEVFQLLRPLGIGARGMDTEAERKFLLKVMTGEISLEKETLIQMAKLRINATDKTINAWNQRIDKGELDDWFTNSGVTKEKIKTSEERGKDEDRGGDPLGLGF